MSKSHTPNSALAGVILAGGQAKRLHGRDKAFLSVGGTFLLDRCIVRLKGQIDRIVISGNGDPCRFEASGLPVMGDLFGSFPGPLAGIYTAMRWCEANAPEAQAILSVAVDTPFFPINLADKLSTASGRMCEKIVLSRSSGGVQPTFGLWPVVLADDLERYLSGGGRKVRQWAQEHQCAFVDFADMSVDGDCHDPFYNINFAEDLALADRIARKQETHIP